MSYYYWRDVVISFSEIDLIETKNKLRKALARIQELETEKSELTAQIAGMKKFKKGK